MAKDAPKINQGFQVTGHTVLDNLRHEPVKDLMPPAYLWLTNSKVAHLASPGTFPTEEKSFEENGTYRIPCHGRPNPRLRCFREGFFLDEGSKPVVSANRPPHLRLCKRCVTVVGAALTRQIKDMMVGAITRAIREHFKLGYYRSGCAYTDTVLPLHGSKPGSVKFVFLVEKMQEIEVLLLDVDTWTWLTEQPTNDNWGAWIGEEIVRRLGQLNKEQEQNFQAWHKLEEDVLEDGLFSDL